MKYKIIYGTSVAAFPKSALDVLKRAGADELKVLICLCANEGNTDDKKLSRLSGLDMEAVRAALSFWRGAGVIENAGIDADASCEVSDGVAEQKSEQIAEQKSEKEQKKKLSRADELPNYTSEQLSNIIDAREELPILINECQNILGKVFSIHEINVLIGLVDYLSLDLEYIMMLLTYCVSIGRRTLHYAEKLAFAFYDAGICTAGELSEELRRREVSAAAEGRIRALFGIGERAFTSKEKKFIASWTGEMGYGMDIIEKAYEVTADATGKGSFPYANSVLERWNAAGLRTLEAVEESYKKDRAGAEENSTSTFTDDFFDAAVRRALGDN